MMLPSQLPLLDALGGETRSLELELADDDGVAVAAEDHAVAVEAAMEQAGALRSPAAR